MSTIAAISTPKGQGGIGVIRISGKDSKLIADKVFKSVSGKQVQKMHGYTASFGKITENDEIIDDCILLAFTAPNSYTGEDVVEISCHGGLFVTRQVLRVVLNAGAIPAEPGEFTKRAFLNGKMDLTKAEAVMDIISATGKKAAKAAIALGNGAVQKKVNKVKSKLLETAAHLCAWADYPEDDIAHIDEKNLYDTLSSCKKELDNLINTYDCGRILKYGINTVIVGKPNVGKSTLMNRLSGFDRSIVTDIPGTTRDIIEENVNIGDVTLNLSDTAGIHTTDDIVESIGIDKAKERIESAELVLALFDSSNTLSDDDLKLINILPPEKTIAIINKMDLPLSIDLTIVRKYVENLVFISAKLDDGIDDLRKTILKAVGISNINEEDGVLSTERQVNSIKTARNSIEEALKALSYSVTLDAITVLIGDALDELLKFTGEKASATIVDEVFSKFCIGK